MSANAEDQSERVIARLRPRGRHLIWPALLVIALAGVSVYYLGTLPEAWQRYAVLILGGSATLVLVIVPYLSWLSRRYIITTRRIVIRRGLFIRVHQELLHSRSYDVTLRQDALQSLSRCGDIRINTGLESPVILRDVPQPKLVLRAIQDLMQGSSDAVPANRGAAQSTYTDETTVLGRL